MSNAIQIVFQTCPHFSLPPVPFIVRVSSGAGRRRLHSNPLISTNRELINSNAISQRPPVPIGTIMVAYVKDGNIQVWDEATGQTRTIFDAGDAIGVSVSDDGQVLAFLRRSAVQLARGSLDQLERTIDVVGH